MLSAIDLDDEALFEADEIDNVDPERMLAAKAIARELAFAQLTPEFALTVGHVTA